MDQGVKSVQDLALKFKVSRNAIAIQLDWALELDNPPEVSGSGDSGLSSTHSNTRGPIEPAMIEVPCPGCITGRERGPEYHG